MGWPEVLDDIEGRLAEVDRELSTGTPSVSAFELPAGLGPLPDELRERAGRALRQTRIKQAEAERARDRIGDALHQGRVVPREPAAYLDTWI
ncbi:MAG TPA: hypothetical protein VN816_07935 [Acidimicrobiales bacterium]|nr:hypothetical protein [Acidimicrobiales bacterium]